MKHLPNQPEGSFTLDEDDTPDLASYLTEETPASDDQPALPQVHEAAQTLPAALPVVGPYKRTPAIKLDKLELPSGYKIDPEELGIDLEYMPSAGPSTFATDLEDEPVHLVEMPAELREFMNSEEAKNLTPDQLKEVVGSALQEEALKLWKVAKAKAGVKDQHTAIVRGSVLAGVVLFLLVFSVKTAVLIGLIGFLTVAGVYFWDRADSTQEGFNGTIGRFKEQLSVYRAKAATQLDEARARFAAQQAARDEAARLAGPNQPLELPPVEHVETGEGRQG